MEQHGPEQLLEFAIQFRHLEKILADLPGINDALCAAAFGVNIETYRGIRHGLTERARAAASDLLDDPAFAASVDRLPFAPGEVVVGLGDSITDDDESWLTILRYLLELRRNQDGIEVINAGVSGDTTSQMISRFPGVALHQPNWIICNAGTNDARRHGRSATKVLVSPDETEKNMKMLRNLAATETSARWVWMTPATVIEDKVMAFWLPPPFQVMFRNSDLVAVAELVRRQPDPVVDVQAVFGLPPHPELLLFDGLHPSLAGQKVIVKALVERLGSEHRDCSQ